MAERQLCTFRLGGLLVGIDVAQVREVLTGPRVTPVPLAPPAVRGLLNLRGQVLTVVDARIRLGLPAGEQLAGAHVIIDQGSESTSLVVDCDDEVVKIDDAGLQTVPTTVSEVIRACSVGAYQLETELLIVVDVSLILSFAK